MVAEIAWPGQTAESQAKIIELLADDKDPKETGIAIVKASPSWKSGGSHFLELEFRQRAHAVIDEAVASNSCDADNAPKELLQLLRCTAEAATYVVHQLALPENLYDKETLKTMRGWWLMVLQLLEELSAIIPFGWLEDLCDVIREYGPPIRKVLLEIVEKRMDKESEKYEKQLEESNTEIGSKDAQRVELEKELKKDWVVWKETQEKEEAARKAERAKKRKAWDDLDMVLSKNKRIVEQDKERWSKEDNNLHRTRKVEKEKREQAHQRRRQELEKKIADEVKKIKQAAFESWKKIAVLS